MQIKMLHFCPSPSDGTGRAGTYILIDMVLNRMAKGKGLTHTHTRKHKQMITQITLYIIRLRGHQRATVVKVVGQLDNSTSVTF